MEWMGYEGGKHGLDSGLVNMLKRHGKLEIDFNDSILITMIVICKRYSKTRDTGRYDASGM